MAHQVFMNCRHDKSLEYNKWRKTENYRAVRVKSQGGGKKSGTWRDVTYGDVTEIEFYKTQFCGEEFRHDVSRPLRLSTSTYKTGSIMFTSIKLDGLITV